MTWQNSDLVVYHGSDEVSANRIRKTSMTSQNGIDLKLCKPRTDFGRGFYTTTNLHQARNWANLRAKRLNAASANSARATVIQFSVKRDEFTRLNTLCFVTEGLNPGNSDYWEFVSSCRNATISDHQFKPDPALPATSNYDVVIGIVSLWPQTLVVKDCDQVSFHTPKAITFLLSPTLILTGNPYL